MPYCPPLLHPSGRRFGPCRAHRSDQDICNTLTCGDVCNGLPSTTPEEAARILEEAWDDPDWGMLVWLTMTTGARRGELCGLRWSHLSLPNSVLTIRRAIAQHRADRFEKDTKTHKQRRVSLDPETVKALTEHWERCSTRCEALGVPLSRDAFVFSPAPDRRAHLVPSSVSQRYSRLAARLGIDTHLHCLRHYPATELIAAGVDVRTVAGRLGHNGGGVTRRVGAGPGGCRRGVRSRVREHVRALTRPVSRAAGPQRLGRRTAEPRTVGVGEAPEVGESPAEGDVGDGVRAARQVPVGAFQSDES